MTTILYRYWQGDHLLYVGITDHPEARRASHRKNAAWWSRHDRYAVERYATRADARAAELNAIRAERPECNVESNGSQRRWSCASCGKGIAIKATHVACEGAVYCVHCIVKHDGCTGHQFASLAAARIMFPEALESTP